ncbi:hypothetical protein AC1031_020373 [Aphanomyces cochlioides]|nr:hypothetical protein AC1031_020373 [Aphanomyces cochlioides]
MAPVAPTRRSRVAWDADSATVDGTRGKSSLEVLLDWICLLPNYQRWKGDTQHGVTKEVLCTEINSIMKANGITHRSNQDIRTKIGDLERSYRTAIDWKANTGQGILDSDVLGGTSTVDAYVLKLCRHFNLIDGVMRNCPSSRPLLTSDAVLDSSCETNAMDSEVTVDHINDEDEDSLVLAQPTQVENEEQKKSHKRKFFSQSTSNNGRSKRLFGSLKTLLNDPSEIEKGRLEIEANKLGIEEERLTMAKSKNDLECSLLQRNVSLKDIEIATEKLLSRKRLLDAGISPADVDAALPLNN